MADEHDHDLDDGPSPVAIVIAAILAIGVVSFIAQNTDEVEVTWLAFDATAPLWAVLVVTAAASMVAGKLLGAVIRRRR